jgi:hypothetical protein
LTDTTLLMVYTSAVRAQATPDYTTIDGIMTELHASVFMNWIDSAQQGRFAWRAAPVVAWGLPH